MHYLTTLIIITGIFFNIGKLDQPKLLTQVDVPQIVDLEINHFYGEQIDIRARLVPHENIRKIFVSIFTSDRTLLTRDPVIVTSEGEIYYILDLTQQQIRAFETLNIWFDIEMLDSTIHEVDPIKYFYKDNRFEWQSLKTDEFSVHWYQDDPNLGDIILDTAYEGLSRIEDQVQVQTPVDVQIYAYASVIDLQETLNSGGTSSWVAGHADPDLNILVVSLPPGPEQNFEIRRQIPHELTHILLYEKLGSGYPNLPRWLNEGLASAAELSPNPDYQLLLEKAYDRGSLIPIHELCTNFPIDAANFQLAYAESYSFTWYLEQVYGIDQVEALIEAYADGENCHQGIQTVFDMQLEELEAEWRQTMLSEAPPITIEDYTISLIIIFGVVLFVPMGYIAIGTGRRDKE